MGAQRGSVIANKDGTYSVRYSLGATRRQDGTFATKTAAQRHLRGVLSAVDNGLRGDLTLSALSDRWLGVYDAAPATQARVRVQLGIINGAFGSVLVRKLTPEQIGAWRLTVSEGQRHQVHGLLRQVLEAAVRWGYATSNPARMVPNPSPKRLEMGIFRDWTQLEAVAHEIGPRYAPLVIFSAGSGLRTSEWAAREWRDVNLAKRVITVQRSFTSVAGAKAYGKTVGSRRRVPLRSRVIDAMPPTTRGLVFPAERGGHIVLHNWRTRFWAPAIEAAGLPPMRPYSMRHTYAAWSLAAGVGLFTLARRMGTSVDMLQQTYGHLTHDADDTEIGTLDAWDSL